VSDIAHTMAMIGCKTPGDIPGQHVRRLQRFERLVHRVPESDAAQACRH
jgi:hypothetical protein